MENTNTQSTYYDSHARFEADRATTSTIPACFSAPKSTAAWLQRRKLEMIQPLIKVNSEATWVTIGDGGYGSDASYLQQEGASVVATSLTDSSLKIAKEKGYIQQYDVQNAEQIMYPDNSFDFVLCKEAYHHFPRPPIAFYEMLRVAKSAVILIEPYDGPKRLLDFIKSPFKKLLWGKEQTINFEPCGNYIYRIHPHDIEKKLTALGHSAIAYKKFNDFCWPKYSLTNAGTSFGYIIIKLIMAIMDLFSSMRLLNPASIMIIAFKNKPEKSMVNALKKARFTVNSLPTNPYLT